MNLSKDKKTCLSEIPFGEEGVGYVGYNIQSSIFLTRYYFKDNVFIHPSFVLFFVR